MTLLMSVRNPPLRVLRGGVQSGPSDEPFQTKLSRRAKRKLMQSAAQAQQAQSHLAECPDGPAGPDGTDDPFFDSSINKQQWECDLKHTLHMLSDAKQTGCEWAVAHFAAKLTHIMTNMPSCTMEK